MTKLAHGKLNRLQELPEGALVDAGWLERHGYSTSLRSQYVKAGWLNQPARRVYRRSHGPLDWKQVVISLQAFLDSPQTVGGKTALEERGFAHYLKQPTSVIELYGPERPPSWLNTLPMETKFRWHNSRRLFPDDTSLVRKEEAEPAFASNPSLPGGFMAFSGGVTWPLRLSSIERALLELLDELPNHESFHEVDMLMEGLSNLSPRRLQELLETCRSIKVKRLFFFFADRHQHAWLKHINRDKIDLGSGKRVLAKNGRLDATYGITVPEDLHGTR